VNAAKKKRLNTWSLAMINGPQSDAAIVTPITVDWLPFAFP
jgi:hypothetical protein